MLSVKYNVASLIKSTVVYN